jgi:hypothetical protein
VVRPDLGVVTSAGEGCRANSGEYAGDVNSAGSVDGEFSDDPVADVNSTEPVADDEG